MFIVKTLNSKHSSNINSQCEVDTNLRKVTVRRDSCYLMFLTILFYLMLEDSEIGKIRNPGYQKT